MGDYIRAGAFLGFSALTEELGADPNSILHRAGINPKHLEHADNAISATAATNALLLASTETQCPDFGLRLGSRQNLATMGPIALLALQSETIASAITTTQRFLHLHNACAILDVQSYNNKTLLRYDDTTPDSPRNIHNCLIALALGIQFFRHFKGKEWAPESIHFIHSEPRDCSYYRCFFDAPLFFDQEFYAIECQTETLLDRHPKTSTGNKKELTHHLLQLEKNQEQSFRVIATRLIHSLLITGECSEQNIANILRISPRTLQRKLKLEGVSFNQLLTTIRINLSKQYLQDSDISLTDLSTVLGYSELSSFTRFFTTHFKMPPTQYRDQFA